MNQLEEKLFNHLKTNNCINWTLDSVTIDPNCVNVSWIHTNDFLHTPHRVTYTSTLYTLPEDYDKARLMIQDLKDSTGNTYYDCGVSSTVFAMNTKMFIMVKDGDLCCSFGSEI